MNSSVKSKTATWCSQYGALITMEYEGSPFVDDWRAPVPIKRVYCPLGTGYQLCIRLGHTLSHTVHWLETADSYIPIIPDINCFTCLMSLTLHCWGRDSQSIQNAFWNNIDLYIVESKKASPGLHVYGGTSQALSPSLYLWGCISLVFFPRGKLSHALNKVLQNPKFLIKTNNLD